MCENCGDPKIRHEMSFARRDVLAIGALFSAALALPAVAADDTAPPKPQNVLSPEDALKRLKDGNARYVQGVAKRHDFVAEREVLVGGQNPFAGILSCADSR